MTKKTCRIVVAGVCGSGKTTLVEGLKNRGYLARSVAQEHSFAPRMYTMNQPDFVILLDAEYQTVRERRRVAWDERRLEIQRKRLLHVKNHCHFYLPTDVFNCQEVLERSVYAIETFIAERNERI